MAKTLCGFNDGPGGSGRDLLATWGPTLFVDIGFDPNFKLGIPVPGITRVEALVDTGASESCIDSLLAAQLNLPVVDRRQIAGVGGGHIANVHLAQVRIPLLNKTILGSFTAVHLAVGGQRHRALIGRSFLQHFTMVYEGRTGTVTLTDEI